MAHLIAPKPLDEQLPVFYIVGEVVRALPRRSKTVCYVNPESPDEAAISREFHANNRTVIFPVVLLLLGILGIVCVIMASVPDKNARTDSTERTG